MQTAPDEAGAVCLSIRGSVLMSMRLQVHGRAAAALGGDLVGDLLAFLKRQQAGALDGADVHEHVLAAAIRLYEPITLGGVEPLDRSGSHLPSVLVARGDGRCTDVAKRHNLVWG